MSMRIVLTGVLFTSFLSSCVGTPGSPLLDAAWKGDESEVASLLSKGESPDARGEGGRTALMNAAGAPGSGVHIGSSGQIQATRVPGHVDLPTIRILLERGADRNLMDDSGQTALFFAAHSGSAEAVSMLLAAGADPNAGKQTSPLLAASSEDHLDVVKQLLAAGADPKNGNVNGLTPLMSAAYGGNVAILRELLQAGASIDATDKTGHTALCNAAHQGQLEAAKFLIEAGASLDIRSAKGKTALAIAAERGHAACADFLRSAGAHE